MQYSPYSQCTEASLSPQKNIGIGGGDTKKMKELICGKTQQEIEILKQEKGALVLIEVQNQMQKHQAIFREPTFKDLEVINKLSKSNEIQGLRAAYDNLIIVCDEPISQRDMLKIKAVEALMTRVEKTTSSAKNL